METLLKDFGFPFNNLLKLYMVQESKKHYAYDFKNPQRLAKPIKVNVEKHTWVEVSDEIEFCYKKLLF